MFLGLRDIGGAQGGVETHVAMLSAALIARGARVTVLARAPYCAGPRRSGALRVVPLASPRGPRTEAIGHSLRGVIHAARHRPDILHIHAVGPSVVIPLARLLGLRVVATHHGKDYAREKWGRTARCVLRLGEAMQRRFAQGRIAISRSLCDDLAAARPDLPGYRFIPNGAPRVTPRIATDALAARGLAPLRYVLNVGRIVPEKRQIDLVRAFRAADLPADIRLVLAGAADHDSPYARALRREVGDDPRILCAGFVTGEALAQLYSHAGLFCLPSSHEGLPIALIEAMAHGRPVLAASIPGTRELALGGGAYHRVGDTGAMARAIRAAFPAGPARDWGAQLAPYDWGRIATATLELYAQVLGSAR